MKIISEIEVKKGRRLYGHLVTLEDGRKVYFAKRRHAQIFRGGKVSISGAMTEGVASWAIDESTLYSMRAKGACMAGVRVTDTGDIYITDIANFFDLKKAGIRDYTSIGRGGSRQRYLPLQHFTLSKGEVELPINRIIPC